MTNGVDTASAQLNKKRIPIPSFRQGRWYESLDNFTCEQNDAVHVISQIPFISLSSDLRKYRSLQAIPNVPNEKRASILRRAISRFVNGNASVGTWTQSVQEFKDSVYTAIGVPGPLLAQWNGYLADYVEYLCKNVPAEIGTNEVWLISLSSNSNTCLEACLDAIYRGATVWIKPSHNEVYSAVRLVACLLEEGWPPLKIGFYVLDKSVFQRIAPLVDHVLAYGGEDVQATFKGYNNVEVFGPCKILAVVHPSFEDDNKITDRLVKMICAESGRFCNNVSAIICLKQNPAIVNDLARKMDRIRLTGQNEVGFHFASWTNEKALSIEKKILNKMLGGDRKVTKRSLRVQVDDRLFLAPTLIQIANPLGHPLFGREYLFPFATFTYINERDLSSFLDEFPYQYIFTNNKVQSHF